MSAPITSAFTNDGYPPVLGSIGDQYLEPSLNYECPFKDFVGSSPAIQQTLEQIRLVAGTDSTVLLTGETGTGKELLARAIHDNSPRKEQKFITLCRSQQIMTKSYRDVGSQPLSKLLILRGRKVLMRHS